MESSESNNSVRSAASPNGIGCNGATRGEGPTQKSAVRPSFGRTDSRTDVGESALAGEKAGKKGWKEERGENKESGRRREGGPQNDQAHLYSDGAAAIVTCNWVEPTMEHDREREKSPLLNVRETFNRRTVQLSCDCKIGSVVVVTLN